MLGGRLKVLIRPGLAMYITALEGLFRQRFHNLFINCPLHSSLHAMRARIHTFSGVASSFPFAFSASFYHFPPFFYHSPFKNT